MTDENLVLGAIGRKFSDPENYELPDSERAPARTEPSEPRYPVYQKPLVPMRAPKQCRDCGELVFIVLTLQGRYLPLNAVSEDSGMWLYRLQPDGRWNQAGNKHEPGKSVHRCKAKPEEGDDNP